MAKFSIECDLDEGGRVKVLGVKQPQKRRERTLEKAIEFLQKRLATDAIPAMDLFIDAEAQGISKRSVYEAGRELDVIKYPVYGAGRQWVWELSK